MTKCDWDFDATKLLPSAAAVVAHTISIPQFPPTTGSYERNNICIHPGKGVLSKCVFIGTAGAADVDEGISPYALKAVAAGKLPVETPEELAFDLTASELSEKVIAVEAEVVIAGQEQREGVSSDVRVFDTKHKEAVAELAAVEMQGRGLSL
ncbi:hypothetical protein TIFTF001_024252 [Ficus carica]|uniref:Uncharacterized protein n=1 Tax=Ficus carica TaxID=3494 RepID=A0AA88DEI9_FICCA|nr:hypothetical protein TIFTF001_024252 [Ficus carica]